jgi:hypothetical protein
VVPRQPEGGELAVSGPLIEQHAGPCRRRRPGCSEAGIWKPFYRGYICPDCLALDSQDVLAGRNPPGDGGNGTLFQKDDEL